MRDRALRRGHVLGDLAPHADDLDRLVRTGPARPRRLIALTRAVPQIRVEIGMTHPVRLGLHRRQINPQIPRPRPHRGRRQRMRLGGSDLLVTPPRRRPGPSWRGRRNNGLRVVTGAPHLGSGLRRGGGGRRFDHLLDPRILRLILLGRLRLRRRQRRRHDLAPGVDRIRLDHHQRGTDRHLIPDLARQLDDDARYGRLHLDRRLVGHHVRDRRILLDAVADRDMPCDDLGLRDAFADIRQFEGKASHYASFMIFLRASVIRTGPGK